MTRPSIDQQITFLYTPNLEASVHFYEEILGLPPALDQGTCRIYRVSKGGYLGVCQRDEQPVVDSLIVTIATQDVDGWYHFLRDKGVAFEKPPTLNPQYNIYHCFLRDPNGYLIEIQRFLDPAWPLS